MTDFKGTDEGGAADETGTAMFDLSLIGVLALAGLAGLILELLPLLSQGAWPEPPSALFGPHLAATAVYSVLFAVAVWVGRKIGQVWTILCALPFLILALLPFLAAPPPGTLEQLRTTTEGFAVRLASVEAALTAQGDQLLGQRNQVDRVRRVVGPTDFLVGTRSGQWHDLTVNETTHFCFLMGVRGKWEGGGEEAYVTTREGTWQVYVRTQQPAVAVTAACLALPVAE